MVYLGTDDTSGEKHAIKVLRLAKSAQKEIEVMGRLSKHPHIIEHKRSIVLEDKTCLVMEYCSGGNLNDYRLNNCREPGRDLRFMREIASAVAFLHRTGIIHYDLKPDNILLTSTGNLKVADLGISKLASESKQGGSLYDYYTNGNCGHIYFCAPELFKGRSTERADIFQMGVIFACLLQKRKAVRNGQSLLVGVFVNRMGVGQALDKGFLQRYELDERLTISQDLRTLVEHMLLKDHHARPSADTVDKRLEDITEWPSPYSQQQHVDSRLEIVNDSHLGEGPKYTSVLLAIGAELLALYLKAR